MKLSSLERHDEIRQLILAEDFDGASSLLEPLALRGSADAQFVLGYLYFGGSDMEESTSRAWLQRAADQGHAEARFHLIRWDDFGEPLGGEAPWALLEQAAEGGCREAQYSLGATLATGDGRPRDPRAARRWYRLAAGQDSASACANLGFMCLEGDGGPVDLDEARRWWRQAVEIAIRDRDHVPAAADAARLLAEYQGPPETWEAERRRIEAFDFRPHPHWFYR